MSEKFKDCVVKRETTLYIAEHEVMLAFNSDWQAEAFEDWFESVGRVRFAAWLEENNKDYQ
jgi:hypothetical protein